MPNVLRAITSARKTGRASRARRMFAGGLAGLAILLAWPGPAARADSARYFYDPAGQLSAVVDPANGSALYTYDAAGNLLSIARKAATALVVADATPAGAAIGKTVTISGTGFGTTSNTTVSFNGKTATPTAVSATQITVAVPQGATTGTVSVTVPSGTAKLQNSFIVTTPVLPTLAALPTQIVDRNTMLTLNGSNFDTVVSNNKLEINGIYTNIQSASSSRLNFIVPSNAISGLVSLQTPNGQVFSKNDLVIPPYPYLSNDIEVVSNANLGEVVSVSVNSSGRVGLIPTALCTNAFSP